MTVNEVSPASRSTLPEIARSRISVLWVNDFYDGPLKGIAEIDGRRVLFDLVDHGLLGAEDEDRTYWLIALDPTQLTDEEYWHDLFCRRVGTHFDYTGRAAPQPEDVNYDEFYLPYGQRIEPDYGHNEVIGWFRF